MLDLPDKLLLFDLPEYNEELKNYFLSFSKPMYAILSHGSCGIADGSRWQKHTGLQVYLDEKDAEHPWLRMQPDQLYNQPPVFAAHLMVINTPGHSAGSTCLYDRQNKILFSGDTVEPMENGEIYDFTQNRPKEYEDFEKQLKSIKQLSELEVDHIMPFHRHILMDGAKQALASFLEKR